MLIFTAALCAQINGSIPVVSNVTMQQTGDKVYVRYDLSITTNPVDCRVSLVISGDGGETFDIYAHPYYLFGDIGDNVTPGSDKEIIWLISEQAENEGGQNISGNTYRVRVIAGRNDEVEYIQGGTFSIAAYNVTLSDYKIGTHEVTQEEYEAVMGLNPSEFSTYPNTPVELVSWYDAIEYCNRRSIQEGLQPCYSYNDGVNYGTDPDNWPSGWKPSEWDMDDDNHLNITFNQSARGYRLPTEMEWEFAARGGVPAQNGGTFSDNYAGTSLVSELTNYAWYDLNSGNTTRTVGTKLANELDLFDMNGNVYEWCWDLYDSFPSGNYNDPAGSSTGHYRIVKGGSYAMDYYNTQLSNRNNMEASFKHSSFGFRVAKRISSPQPDEWCYVPAGNYTWGQTGETANISYDYRMMKYQVTNDQYITYLEEAYSDGNIWLSGNEIIGYYNGDEHWEAGNYTLYTMGTPDTGSNVGRIDFIGGEFILYPPSGYVLSDYLNHPVVYVTWFGAWHYAKHYNLRLPTEQEWEKAARGMTGYDYPWGNTIDGSRANYSDSGDPYDNGTTPAGYYDGSTHYGYATTDSPSPYGVYDMSGNVSDWTDSWLNQFRIIRGGSWSNNPTYHDLKSWNRPATIPTVSDYQRGFRCVLPLSFDE